MDLSEKISILPILLNLKKQIVGIKIIKDEKEFDLINAEQLNSKITYCCMVKLASRGRHFKANAENFWCEGALKALGLMEVPDNVLSGEVYESLGLYKNRDIAKNAQSDVLYIEDKNYGVEVFPLDVYSKKAFDIAIIIDFSYAMMRILQGYSYYYGINKGIRIGGNQAICSEVTANPYINDDINLSMLCSGTRFFAKWDENDVAIGIPYSKMENIIDGIINTINSTENDKRKLEIIKNLYEIGVDLNIEVGKNYYV